MPALLVILVFARCQVSVVAYPEGTEGPPGGRLEGRPLRVQAGARVPVEYYSSVALRRPFGGLGGVQLRGLPPFPPQLASLAGAQSAGHWETRSTRAPSLPLFYGRAPVAMCWPWPSAWVAPLPSPFAQAITVHVAMKGFLGNFTAQNLANFAWALASLGVQDERLMTGLASTDASVGPKPPHNRPQCAKANASILDRAVARTRSLRCYRQGQIWGDCYACDCLAGAGQARRCTGSGNLHPAAYGHYVCLRSH